MREGHAKPVNRTAALVVSRGESFDFVVSCGAVNSNAPMPIRDPSAGELKTKFFKDLSKTVFGRLTVLGISELVNKRWVCRCVCGIYVLRSSSAIKAGASDACCDQCYLLAVSKRNEYTRRTGKTDKPTRDFL